MYKIGDKIRNKITGEIDVVESIPGMKEYDEKGFMAAEKGFMTKKGLWARQDDEDWELLIDRIFISTPTIEDWKNVVGLLINDLGCKWYEGQQNLMEKYWDKNQCVYVETNKLFHYMYDYQIGYKKLTAQEFLEKYGKGYKAIVNCPFPSQHTIQHIIDKMFYSKCDNIIINGNLPREGKLKKMRAYLLRKLSPSKRVLYENDYIQEDLSLTEDGKELLMDILADKFEKEMVEIAKEEEEKKKVGVDN